MDESGFEKYLRRRGKKTHVISEAVGSVQVRGNKECTSRVIFRGWNRHTAQDGSMESRRFTGNVGTIC